MTGKHVEMKEGPILADAYASGAHGKETMMQPFPKPDAPYNCFDINFTRLSSRAATNAVFTVLRHVAVLFSTLLDAAPLRPSGQGSACPPVPGRQRGRGSTRPI